MKDLPECEQVLKRPCKKVHGKAALYSKCTESFHRLLGHKCRTISEEVQLVVDGIQLEHKPVLVYYASITIQLVHTRGSYFILLADRQCEIVKHSSYSTLVRTMENLRSAYERYFGLRYQEVRVAVPEESDAPDVAVERETLVWSFGKSFVTDGAEFYYKTQIEWEGEAKGGDAEGADKKGGGEERPEMAASLLDGEGGLHAKEGVPNVCGGESCQAGGRLSSKRRSSLSPEKKADERGPTEMSQQEDATPHDETNRSVSEEDASAQQALVSPKKEESGDLSMFFENPPTNSQHSDEDSAHGRTSLQDSHSERESGREQGLSTENCASSPGHGSSSAAEQDALHSTSAQTPPGSAGRSPLPCYSGARNYGAGDGRESATQSACSTSSVYAVLQRRSAWRKAVQGAAGIHLSQAYAAYFEETSPGEEKSLQMRGGYSGSLPATGLSQDAAASQCYARSASTCVFPENTQCTQRHTEKAGAKQGTNAGAQQSHFHRGSGYPVTSSYQVRGAHPQSTMAETGAVSAKLRKFPAMQQDAISEEPPLHPDAPQPSSVHAVRPSHILHLSRPIVRQKQVPNAHSVQAAMSEPLPFNKPAMAVGRAAELMAMMSSEKGIRNGEKRTQAVGNEEDFESQAGMPDIF